MFMKNMTKIICVFSFVILLFVFIVSSYGDNQVEGAMVVNTIYNELKDSAYMYVDENDSLALVYLLKAFKEETPQNPRHLYDAGALAARLGQKKLAFEMLEMSVNKGYSYYDHMKKNTNFPSFDEVRFNLCLDKVRKRDSLLYRVSEGLDSVFKLDQDIREQFENEILRKGKDTESAEAKIILDSMRIIDDKNLEYVNKLMDNNGFLGNSLKTKKSKLTMYLIYLHAPIEVLENKLGIIRQAVKNGELEVQLYPNFEDKILSIRKGVQKYGTQYRVLNGEVVFVPLLDSLNVDLYRSEFNLGSFESFAKWIKGQ